MSRSDLRSKLSEHVAQLRKYALALVRDADEAEDLVQESLMRAIAGAETWQPGRDLRKWLFGILHNTYVSSIRHYEVRARAARFIKANAAGNVLPDQVERIEFSETIKALDRLPEEQRQVLVLVALEGMRYQEVADLLGIPIGTLMSRLARGRETLRISAARDPAKKIHLVK